MATRRYTRKTPTKTQEAPVVIKAPVSEFVTVCLRSPYDITFDVDERSIVIKGHNSRLRGLDGGILDSGRAFGETVIPAKDWEAIKRKFGQDPNSKLFTGGFIFAAKSKEDARAEAKEKENLKTGLEPIDTTKTATKSEK